MVLSNRGSATVARAGSAASKQPSPQSYFILGTKETIELPTAIGYSSSAHLYRGGSYVSRGDEIKTPNTPRNKSG